MKISKDARILQSFGIRGKVHRTSRGSKKQHPAIATEVHQLLVHSSRASKGIKKKVDDFLHSIDCSMGVTALILVKYKNSEGQGSVGL
jgi:hypothetical protein